VTPLEEGEIFPISATGRKQRRVTLAERLSQGEGKQVLIQFRNVRFLPKQARYRAALRPDAGITTTCTLPRLRRRGKCYYGVSCVLLEFSRCLMQIFRAESYYSADASVLTCG